MTTVERQHNELTRYPEVFRFYWAWGTSPCDDVIIQNRNSFVHDFNISLKQPKTIPDEVYVPNPLNQNDHDHVEYYFTNDKRWVVLNSPYGLDKTDRDARLGALGYRKIFPMYDTYATTYAKVLVEQTLTDGFRIKSGYLSKKKFQLVCRHLEAYFGRGYQFRPQLQSTLSSISYFGIECTQWPNKEAGSTQIKSLEFTYIRLEFGVRFMSDVDNTPESQLRLTSAAEQDHIFQEFSWAVNNNDVLVDFKDKTRFVILKALNGAPVWTTSEINHVIEVLLQHDIITYKKGRFQKSKLRSFWPAVF